MGGHGGAPPEHWLCIYSGFLLSVANDRTITLETLDMPVQAGGKASGVKGHFVTKLGGSSKAKSTPKAVDKILAKLLRMPALLDDNLQAIPKASLRTWASGRGHDVLREMAGRLSQPTLDAQFETERLFYQMRSVQLELARDAASAAGGVVGHDELLPLMQRVLLLANQPKLFSILLKLRAYCEDEHDVSRPHFESVYRDVEISVKAIFMHGLAQWRKANREMMLWQALAARTPAPPAHDAVKDAMRAQAAVLAATSTPVAELDVVKQLQARLETMESALWEKGTFSGATHIYGTISTNGYLHSLAHAMRTFALGVVAA